MSTEVSTPKHYGKSTRNAVSLLWEGVPLKKGFFSLKDGEFPTSLKKLLERFVRIELTFLFSHNHLQPLPAPKLGILDGSCRWYILYTSSTSTYIFIMQMTKTCLIFELM